jgi:superfamily II RNA helicase
MIGPVGLIAVSIETGGVFGYDEVAQRAGRRSMDSNGKFKVMVSEPKLSRKHALRVDEIPNREAKNYFHPDFRAVLQI